MEREGKREARATVEPEGLRYRERERDDGDRKEEEKKGRKEEGDEKEEKERRKGFSFLLQWATEASKWRAGILRTVQVQVLADRPTSSLQARYTSTLQGYRYQPANLSAASWASSSLPPKLLHSFTSFTSMAVGIMFLYIALP